MYATEGGNGLPTNYIHCIRVFSRCTFCQKTQTILLTKRSLNPIIDCPNIGTLNNASVQVYKHGIRQSALLALKITKVGL